MKKALYLIICMLLVGSIANAQKKDSASKKSERIAKELNLSQDQKKKVDDIHADTRKQKEVIQNNNSLTAEQKQQKIKDLNKQEKSKVNAVLTPEQQQKAKEARENRKKKNTDSSSAPQQ